MYTAEHVGGRCAYAGRSRRVRYVGNLNLKGAINMVTTEQRFTQIEQNVKNAVKANEKEQEEC